MSEYMCALSEMDKEYLAKHLNETDENRRAALDETRKWLSEVKPDLHGRLDDAAILPFLRGCKFDLERTKEKLTNYYTMRRDRTEWFTNRDPLLPEVQELVKLGVFTPLRETFENKLVIIIRTSAHDPYRHDINDVFKTDKMILDVAALEQERAQIYGVAAIFDMTGLGFGHVKQMTTSVIRNAMFAWQNYHCSPKQLEFINAPVYVNVVLNVFKRFLSAKLRKRIRVHFGGIESLHRVVDKKILPPEYGGQGESVESLIGYWNEKLVSYKEWFVEDEQYKAE